MVGTDLRQQLRNYIQSSHEQGILDETFDLVKNLESDGNPQFLSEIFSMFCHDAENGIAELARFLDEPVIDYENVSAFAHQLKGSSSSVGGNRMVLACCELRQACSNKTKEGCFEAFDKVKREYCILRDNLNFIAQMEKTILTNEARRRSQ
ncbi:hypothetical protein I3842_14G105000 [Carya illinoinensis]|uniref:Histidine-containing phosphotransfer protein n=1 Tax=Carya illinoinensis TaxID=32201 RepID=A0A922AHB5_CARIL|nr:hypothetical protein I3842_14G105000 [Carya illinoinensis]